MKQRKLVTTKRITRRHRYYQVTRDVKGRFVKFKKWKPPKIRYMYRTTLAINYVWHRKYYSLKITAYAKHKKDLPSKEDIEEILLLEFQKRRGTYTLQELADAGQQIRIGYEKPTKIKEEKHLIGKTEVSDEYLRDARDKGTSGILKMIWKKIIGGK